MFNIGNIVVYGSQRMSIPKMNVVSDLSEADNDLPTLMIGYHELKNRYELDFLNRKLEDDLFWTFTRSEERTLFNKDLYDFITHCENKLLDGFKYYHIDVLNMRLKSLKKTITHIKTNESQYVIDKDVLFIHTAGITFGFNLGIGDVLGINRNKIFKKLLNYNIGKLPQERIDSIFKQMGDIEFDSALLPYLSEKLPH
jgi:hypothetical protein